MTEDVSANIRETAQFQGVLNDTVAATFAGGFKIRAQDYNGWRTIVEGRAAGSNAQLGFFGVTPVSKPSGLTAADSATVDATYGSEEAGVLENVRTRLGELETKLQALGLLS